MEASIKQTTSFENRIIKEIEALPDAKPQRIFTDFEDEIIRKYYPTKGSHGLAKVLKKTPTQIRSRATRLNVKFNV